MEHALYTRQQLLARRAAARRRLHSRRLAVCVAALALALCVRVAVAMADASPPPQLTVPALTLTLAADPSPTVLAAAAASASSAAREAALASIPKPMLGVYRQAAAVTGVPWQELAAIGSNESDNDLSGAPGIHSGINEANCCSGPAQLCVKTSCGAAWDLYGSGSVYDPLDAFEAAGRYLHVLAREVGESLALQLAAYNAGPTAVARYGGVPPYPETEHYAAKGVALAAALGDTGGATD